MPDDFASVIGYVRDLDLPWDFERPQEAESTFRAELARRQGAAATDARALEIMTQIARAEALQGKLNEAETTLTQVAKLLVDVSEPAPKMRHLLESGRVLTLRRVPSRARTFFFEVWQMAEKSGADSFAIDAANMLSIIETQKNRIEWLLEALRVAMRSTDPRAQLWLGDLRAALGWHYCDLLQLDKARASFEEAIRDFEGQGDAKKVMLAKCGLSRTLRAGNQLEAALAIQEALHSEIKKSPVKQNSLVYEELAECLYALKRTEEATLYFAQAHELLSLNQWNVDNSSQRLKRLKTLGKVK